MKILHPRSYARLVYAILWGMVWGYPALTALIVAVRAGSAFSWDGVLHAWAGILPFFPLPASVRARNTLYFICCMVSVAMNWSGSIMANHKSFSITCMPKVNYKQPLLEEELELDEL